MPCPPLPCLALGIARNADDTRAIVNPLKFQTETLPKKEGCVVILATGYVVWPTKEAEAAGRLTQEMIDDVRIVREWS